MPFIIEKHNTAEIINKMPFMLSFISKVEQPITKIKIFDINKILNKRVKL